MTGAHIAVSLGFALVGVVAYYGVVQFYRSGKNEREKQRQIQSRINRDNEKRIAAVLTLEDNLKCTVKSFDPTHGMVSLVRAQKAVEETFHEWLNEYWDIFYNFSLMSDNSIQIVGIKDGTFKYELPEVLKQFAKRNKK